MVSTTWKRTPPIPKSDASVYNLISNLLPSMKYINGQRDIAICVSWKLLVLVWVHTTVERFGAEWSIISCIGLTKVECIGTNCRKQFANPKNDLNKVKFLGIEKFKTVSIFSFDMDKPSLSTTLPTYSIRGRPKRHFFALSRRPLSLNLSKTLFKFLRNSASPLPYTMQSSRYISQQW